MRHNQLEAASFTSGSKVLPVVIQKITAVGKEHASLLFTVPAGVSTRKGELTAARVAEAITKLYDGRVRVCESAALSHIVDGPRDIYRCMVAVNRPTVPYETASTDGFVNVAANMFADSDDNIWEVSGEADNRVLRRIGSDDLNAVLQERRSRSIATAVSAIDTVPEIHRHDAIMFFDTASEDVKFGIVVGKNKAYVQEERNGRVLPFQAEAVLANAPHDLDAPRFSNAPATETASASVVLEYYKRLYGQNPDFYARLKQVIEEYLHV